MVDGYNTTKLDALIALNKVNPVSARLEYENLIEREPNNYYAQLFYVANLITLGEFDLADKQMNQLEINYTNDEFFMKKTNTVWHLRKNIAFHKIRLLSYQEKYVDLYKSYLENKDFLEGINLGAILLYSKKKVRPDKVHKYDEFSYIFKQICEYSEEDCLEHIKKHLADYNADLENPNSNIFVPNFPIKKVYTEIKKYIPARKKLCYGFYDDSYIFKFDGCGSNGKKIVDYFKVICFHNTSNIITIVPVDKVPNWPVIDLNYLKKEKHKGYNGVLQNHNFVSCGDLVLIDGENYIVRKLQDKNKFSLLKIVSQEESEISFTFRGKRYHVQKNSIVYDKESIFIIESLGKEILDAFETEKKKIADVEKRRKKKAYRVGDIILINYNEYAILDIDGNNLILIDPENNLSCASRHEEYEIVGLISKKHISSLKTIVNYSDVTLSNLLLNSSKKSDQL